MSHSNRRPKQIIATLVVAAFGFVSQVTPSAAAEGPAEGDLRLNVTAQAVDQTTIEAGTGAGYWEFALDGGVFAYGDAQFAGSASGVTDAPIVAMDKTEDGKGYWLAASNGAVFSFGSAQFYGSAHDLHISSPIVDIVRTPGGEGYYLLGADGGVFAFGDAIFYGSGVGEDAFGPLGSGDEAVALEFSASGEGYWIAGEQGEVLAFGDASDSYGDASSLDLNAPIVNLARSAGGDGYYLLALDGGVFAYGDAVFYGSAADDSNWPVSGIVLSDGSEGYYLSAFDGGVFAYGDAAFYGSAANEDLSLPVLGIVRSGPVAI